MTLRVGVNARTFSVDEPSGSVQVGIEITRRLHAHSDIEVVIFGHPSIATYFDEAQVVGGGYHIHSQAYGLLWERVYLHRLAEAYDVEILYCPNTNAPLQSSRSYANITTLHDINALKGMADGFYERFRQWSVPRVLSNSEKVITVSEFSKQEIQDYLGIDESKLEVVYNGIDPYYLSDAPGEPVSLPDRYLLFVGGLNPRKNIKGLVKAYRRVRETTDIDLVLAGPKNKAIFESYRLEEDPGVHHLGFLSKAELKYTYSNATVFVFPSFYEGFGLPPLEAMACGAPVVASNTSSLPEIVGDAALTTDPTSTDDLSVAITTCISNKSTREKLIRKGHERSENFTWDNSLNKLISAFESVCN